MSALAPPKLPAKRPAFFFCNQFTSFNHYMTHKGGVFDSAQQISDLWEKTWAEFHPQEGVLPQLPQFYNRGNWPEIEFGLTK